jgi:hypothetical protein
MAFHETFWAVTATAAPVLGLAAVLSAGNLLDFAIALSDMRSDTTQPMALSPYGIHRIEFNQRLAIWFFLAQLANILAQATLLAVSLWAIVSQANEGPPLLWLAVPVLGLVLLSTAGVLRFSVELWTHQPVGK